MLDCTHRPTRRRVLAGTAAVIGLGGCQSSADGSETVSIGDGENCDQCGMIIADHPGPVGETYYEDNTPTGRDGPALFCSTICTYRHRFQKEQEGWAPTATFLTDYSSVDYDVRTDGGAAVLTHHLDASAFAETSDLTVVANSDVQGAMGAAIIPFTDSGDAEGFAEEYGGQPLPATDIRRELISSG